jgi:hypothetical protein
VLRRELLLVPLAMLTLFGWAYSSWLDGAGGSQIYPDSVYLLEPLFAAVSRSLQRGEHPYWVDTVFGGLPLHDAVQFSITYPFYFFGFGLYGTAREAMTHAHLVALLHVGVLYANSYLLMRVLGLTPLPSLAAASINTFSANTFQYAMSLNFIASESWLPLVLAGVWLALERERPVAGIFVGACAWALLMCATPSQSLIHSLYLVALLYLAFALRHRGERRRVLRATGHLVLLGVLAAAMAAPAVIPAWRDSPDMIRFAGHGAWPGDAALPLSVCLEGQLRPSELLSALMPLSVTEVMGNAYLGPVALLLAFIGLGARPRWLVWTLAGAALYMLLSATGEHLGLVHLNHALPLLGKIREPPRHLVVFVLFTSALAGFGVAELAESGPRRRLLAIAAVALLLLLAWRSGFAWIGGGTRVALVAWSVAAALLCLGKRAAFAVALVIPLQATLDASPRDPPRLTDGEYLKPANLLSHQILASLARDPQVSAGRLLVTDPAFSDQRWAMNGIFYGVRSFFTYMNPLPARQFQHMFNRKHWPHYYPLLGGTHWLCRPCDEQQMVGYHFTRALPGNYRLYASDEALPRYLMMGRLAGSFTDEHDFERKLAAGFPLRTELLVSADAHTGIAAFLGDTTTPLRSSLRVSETSLDRVVLDVENDRPAFVLANEYHSAAWRGSVDGRDVPLVTLNLNQIGIPVERGQHRVELRYRPTLFIACRWVQRLTLLGLCAVMLVIALLRRRRGRSPVVQ